MQEQDRRMCGTYSCRLAITTHLIVCIGGTVFNHPQTIHNIDNKTASSGLPVCNGYMLCSQGWRCDSRRVVPPRYRHIASSIWRNFNLWFFLARFSSIVGPSRFSIGFLVHRLAPSVNSQPIFADLFLVIFVQSEVQMLMHNVDSVQRFLWFNMCLDSVLWTKPHLRRQGNKIHLQTTSPAGTFSVPEFCTSHS